MEAKREHDGYRGDMAASRDAQGRLTVEGRTFTPLPATYRPGDQMDLFSEGARAATIKREYYGNEGELPEGSTMHVGQVGGRLVHVTHVQDSPLVLRGASRSSSFMWGQAGDGQTNAEMGSLAASGPDTHDEFYGGEQGQEISMVHTDPHWQRLGIASALFHLARAGGADLRHSPARSEEGIKWSRRVGGPDVYGYDQRDAMRGQYNAVYSARDPRVGGPWRDKSKDAPGPYREGDVRGERPAPGAGGH